MANKEKSESVKTKKERKATAKTWLTGLAKNLSMTEMEYLQIAMKDKFATLPDAISSFEKKIFEGVQKQVNA